VSYLAEHVVCTFSALGDVTMQISLRADSPSEVVTKGLENGHGCIRFGVRREPLNTHNKESNKRGTRPNSGDPFRFGFIVRVGGPH